MATYTSNFNFRKPLTGEHYDMIADINDMKDKVDDALLYVSAKRFGTVGDGIADDSTVIQTAVNYCATKKRTLYFPSGDYLIGTSIIIPSNGNLICSPFATFKAKNSLNTPIFVNQDTINGNAKISIVGGIFDGNGVNQTSPTTAFMFKKIDGLKLKDITIKNTYGLGTNLGDIQNYEIENIILEQDGLSPNQDGIHISGPATKGYIKHITGTTHDDLVAINADDQAGAWSTGAITDLTIDNIVSSDCYRAVRLLSTVSLVDKITIKNINADPRNGLFEIGNFGLVAGNGNFGEINIENVKGIPDAVVGFFKINGNVDALKISNLNRNDDKTSPVINLLSGFTVKTLMLNNVTINEKATNGATQFILDGNIDNLKVDGFKCEKLSVLLRTFLLRGTIKNLVINNASQKSGKRLIELSFLAVVNSIMISNTDTLNTENLLYSEANIPFLALSNILVDGGDIPVIMNGASAGCRIKTNSFETKNTSQGGRDASKKDFHFSATTGISADGDVSLTAFPNSPKLYDTFIYTGTPNPTRGKVMWNGTKFVNLADGTTN